MESLKIIGLCVGAAILYGICQDMVTARVCVEYFTVGHPPVFGGITDPTLLALTWGVIATWWVGLILGVPAAVLARIGSRPRLGWRDLRWPVGALFVVVGLVAIGAGIIGFVLGGLIEPRFPGDVRATPWFNADASAHGAAYAAGFVGGMLIWGWIWWTRGRAERSLLLDELEALRRENRELLARLQPTS